MTGAIGEMMVDKESEQSTFENLGALLDKLPMSSFTRPVRLERGTVSLYVRPDVSEGTVKSIGKHHIGQVGYTGRLKIIKVDEIQERYQFYGGDREFCLYVEIPKSSWEIMKRDPNPDTLKDLPYLVAPSLNFGSGIEVRIYPDSQPEQAL